MEKHYDSLTGSTDLVKPTVSRSSHQRTPMLARIAFLSETDLVQRSRLSCMFDKVVGRKARVVETCIEQVQAKVSLKLIMEKHYDSLTGSTDLVKPTVSRSSHQRTPMHSSSVSRNLSYHRELDGVTLFVFRIELCRD
jgi:hypothetical protein